MEYGFVSFLAFKILLKTVVSERGGQDKGLPKRPLSSARLAGIRSWRARPRRINNSGEPRTWGRNVLRGGMLRVCYFFSSAVHFWPCVSVL